MRSISLPILILLLVFPAAVPAVAGTTSSTRRHLLSDTRSPRAHELARWLIESVGLQLARIRREGTPRVPSSAPEELEQGAPDYLIVRVHPIGGTPRRGVGRGSTLRESFEAALNDLTANDSLQLTAESAVPSRVGIDIVQKVGRLELFERSEILKTMDPGLEGIEFVGEEGRRIIILPTDIILRNLIDSRGRIDQHAIESTVHPVSLRRLEVTSFVGDHGAGRATTLSRSSAPPPPVTEQTLLDAASMAGDYLVRHQRPDGTYLYDYCPISDRDQGGYNVVRHAGVILSLLTLYHEVPRESYVHSGLRGIRLLHNHMTWNSDRTVALVERDRPNVLGATALSLLAILQLPEERRTEAHVRMARALGRGLAFMTHPSGRFWFRLSDRRSGGAIPPRIPFHPGQSLLALTKLVEQDPNPLLSGVIRRAAAAQIRDFDTYQRPCHWSIQGLAATGKLLQDRPTMAASVKQARALMNGQLSSLPRDDIRHGAWGNPLRPGACMTACHIEALAPAFLAAGRSGVDRQGFETAITHGARFMMGQQYRPGNDFLARNPMASQGGIRNSTQDPSVRMDVPRHAIIAFLRALQLLRQRPWLADPDNS